MSDAFSRRVYRATESIPCGERRSYQWVAKKSGNSKAYRAVGQILKRNPYPLAVPCHRVIKSDKSIGGYVWGVKVKKRLLGLEATYMNKLKKLSLPPDKEEMIKLKAGDEVLLKGTLYTARDAAHKRMVEMIKKGKKLPISIKNEVIYYCGPTPNRKGITIGSCGPTTSSRMDEFTPILLKKGLKGMIGKGRRSKKVREAIKNAQAVYFLAVGGAGAFLSQYVKGAQPIAYKELGAEAIYRLEVENFPVIVGVDAKGRSIYD